MKSIKIPILLLCMFTLSININSFASFIVPVPAKVHTQAFSLKASDFVKLSANEFGSLTGRKMNVWNRISFKFMQLRMKHDLKTNPGLMITDYPAKKTSGALKATAWILIGVTVFVLLLVVGFAIAYHAKK